MKIEDLRRMLAWGIIINYVVLVLWFFLFILAHDWFRDMQMRWFHLTAEQFDLSNYLGVIFYKLGIMLFFLTPYLGLRIAQRRKL
jgi:hypothetical protein